jgi:hypothetical protein
MHVVEDPSDRIGEQQASRRPVIVDDWAEAVVDLRRAQSRRRHPSNREPAWAKDGGYEPTEWAI